MTRSSFPNSHPRCRCPCYHCHSHWIHHRPAHRSRPPLKVARYLLCSQLDPSKKLCTYHPLQQLRCKACKTNPPRMQATSCHAVLQARCLSTPPHAPPDRPRPPPHLPP